MPYLDRVYTWYLKQNIVFHYVSLSTLSGVGKKLAHKDFGVVLPGSKGITYHVDRKGDGVILNVCPPGPIPYRGSNAIGNVTYFIHSGQVCVQSSGGIETSMLENIVETLTGFADERITPHHPHDTTD